MNIVTLDFALGTRSYDIFFSGCMATPKCEGCHNPESWDFKCGTLWRTKTGRIEKDIKDFNSIIDKIFILGGEPLDQDLNELKEFLDILQKQGKPIWLFTRYKLKEVPIWLLDYFSHIKCGPYLPKLSTKDNIQYGVQLATSNQYIYKKGLDY